MYSYSHKVTIKNDCVKSYQTAYVLRCSIPNVHTPMNANIESGFRRYTMIQSAHLYHNYITLIYGKTRRISTIDTKERHTYIRACLCVCWFTVKILCSIFPYRRQTTSVIAINIVDNLRCHTANVGIFFVFFFRYLVFRWVLCLPSTTATEAHKRKKQHPNSHST